MLLEWCAVLKALVASARMRCAGALPGAAVRDVLFLPLNLIFSIGTSRLFIEEL